MTLQRAHFFGINNKGEKEDSKMKLDQKIDNKFLLEENKSFLQRAIHFFTKTLRFTVVGPLLFSGKVAIYRLFGMKYPHES